jgi:hypothetical protein
VLKLMEMNNGRTTQIKIGSSTGSGSIVGIESKF